MLLLGHLFSKIFSPKKCFGIKSLLWTVLQHFTPLILMVEKLFTYEMGFDKSLPHGGNPLNQDSWDYGTYKVPIAPRYSLTPRNPYDRGAVEGSHFQENGCQYRTLRGSAQFGRHNFSGNVVVKINFNKSENYNNFLSTNKSLNKLRRSDFNRMKYGCI